MAERDDRRAFRSQLGDILQELRVFIVDFVLGVAASLAAGVVGVLLAGYLLFVLPRSAIPRRPKD